MKLKTLTATALIASLFSLGAFAGSQALPHGLFPLLLLRRLVRFLSSGARRVLLLVGGLLCLVALNGVFQALAGLEQSTAAHAGFDVLGDEP